MLVTMDLTVVEDYPGFDWSRYAIAWVVVHESHTYTAERHYTTRPSLNRLLRRRR